MLGSRAMMEPLAKATIDFVIARTRMPPDEILTHDGNAEPLKIECGLQLMGEALAGGVGVVHSEIVLRARCPTGVPPRRRTAEHHARRTCRRSHSATYPASVGQGL